MPSFQHLTDRDTLRKGQTSMASGPAVVVILRPNEAYELADFYEFDHPRDAISGEAPHLRSAADKALGREGRRA